MKKNEQKKQPQQVPRQEKRQLLSVGTGSEGTGRSSSEDGCQSIGTARDDWKGGSLSWVIIGGMLDQMVKQAADHLANMNACVEWYTEEARKAAQNLEELQHLQELESRKSNQNPTEQSENP